MWPCRDALCMPTRQGCPILYVPAQREPAKMEALLPNRFRQGTAGVVGQQRGARLGAGRVHARPCASPISHVIYDIFNKILPIQFIKHYCIGHKICGLIVQ